MIVSNKQVTRKDVSQKKTAIFFQKNEPSNFWQSVPVLSSSIIVTERDFNPKLSTEAIKTISKIQNFGKLRENWDGYNAQSPAPGSIKDAVKFIRNLDAVGLTAYFVAPGPNGEILVELKKEEKSAEIYFYPEEEAEYILFERDEMVAEEGLAHRFFTIIQFIQ